MPSPSKIEIVLYGEWADRITASGEVGDHCVLEFSWFRDQVTESDVIRLKVAPWQREYSQSATAIFLSASVGNVTQELHDPEEIELPWSIVGFHCQDYGNGAWGFNLNCSGIRWAWSSNWPTIEHDAHTTSRST
jgi:hypothetical protein